MAFEIQNAQQVPVIECAVASIRLAVFMRLNRKYRNGYESSHAILLAFCVTYTVFCEPITQTTFEAFARVNAASIEREVRHALSDDELSQMILLAYAVRMILLGLLTRDAFNPVAISLTQRANDNNAAIPDILDMWGVDAIGTVFQMAQEFLVRTRAV